MRTISQTTQFKKDYKRETRGQHRATLDANILAIVSLLIADHPLLDKCRDHGLTGEYSSHRDATSNPTCS